MLEELLPRDQREAIKRMDRAHYMVCDVMKVCEGCLVLDALRELVAAIHSARGALGGID